MTSTRGRTAILLAGVAVATAAPTSAQQVTLRWKHEPGSELVYRMANHQEVEMSAVPGTTVTDQIQTMRWRVEDVAANGDATVTVTTERIQLDTQGPAGNVSYDSESGEEPANPQARLLAAMTGLSYTMVIAPDGTVKGVQNLDALRERMLAAMPPDASGMMSGMLDEMFSEESMTRMMQQSVQVFPAEPVGAGDTWPSTFSMPVPMIGSVNSSMEFTVNGIEQREGRTIAVIATAGDIAFGTDANSQLPATLEMGDARLTGTLDFDVDRGIMIGSSMVTTMQMSVTAAGNTMSIDMTQSTGLELIDYAPGG